MPIGNVNRDSGPKRDSYRPPWVKDKNAEAPPPWTQPKLKPVGPNDEAQDAPASSGKTLKPGLKKQSTIRDKTENGTSEESVKPPTKLQERSKAAEERASKFTKSALKSIETIPKLENKLPILEEKGKEKDAEKPAQKVEKPAIKSVRTIDDKAKEKSVTIVDKKTEKNGPKKVNSTTNDKPINKVNSIANDKPVNKVDSAINDKSVNKVESSLTNDKPSSKVNVTNDKPLSKIDDVKNDKQPNKVNSINEKPNPILKTSTVDQRERPPTRANPFERKLKKVEIVDKPTKDEKPGSGDLKNTINDKTPSKTTKVIDKASNEKSEKNTLKSSNKDIEVEPPNPFKVNLRKVPKPVEKPLFEEKPKAEEKPKVEEKAKAEDSSEMATKPPKPMEKTPSKLPPRKPSLTKQPSKDDMGPVKKWRDPLHERVKENIDKTLNNEIPKGHTLTKNESLRSLLKPAPPPMPPPLPPKMPPPPEFKKPPPDPKKLKKIEQLKSRPRRRPDWTDMMKEVEQGKKLKHVECNDRSSPIIATTSVVKNKGQFIFESESPTSHNKLLTEINKGVKLKKTKTNDRSKPNLEGLRKFRRQMTIEEQVQKSMSQANLAASPSGVALAGAEVPNAIQDEEEIDEMDDIDKVRDDLQSTKQLLAIELRNKEAQERENKRLLTRIHNLEAELARERAIIKQEQHKTVISVTDAYDERLVNNLKMEVEKTKENADSLEKQYLDAAEQRDAALTELEEIKRRNAELEKKLEQAMADHEETQYLVEEPLSFYQKRQLEFEKQCRLLDIDINSEEAHALRKSAANNNLAYNNAAYTNTYDEGIMPTNVGSRRSSHAIRQLSVTKDDSFEEESESEPEEEETEEKKQKRIEKEVRNMRNKMRHLKEKQDNMKRERMAYKIMLKNSQAALKDEKRKYKELKREVDKMAAMMKEVGSDDDEDEEEEEEESDDSKKSESEEETETETEQDTESETESESEPEDAPLPKKKDNLTTRLKRHEQRVTALKKGNALLQANVDRLKDDVLKQREESQTLRNELDSLIDNLE